MIVFEYIKLFYYLLRPKVIFVRRFSKAMGDNLLLTGILKKLRNDNPNFKIVVETENWKDFFINNPYIDFVTSLHFKTTKRHIRPKYRIFPETNKSLYTMIGNYVGSDYAYPELFLSSEEITSFAYLNNKKTIAICPEGKQKFSANRKEWGLKNFQDVVNLLKNEFDFVQIGTKGDQLLDGVLDLRGLKIRQSAAVIKNCEIFFGLEGGLMHLAKSVGKSSVIVYGGFIKPEVSGYPGNENLYFETDCSPCFNSEKKLEICSHMSCMKGITVDYVVEKIKNKLRVT
ncbi:MAG: glycosyltransferase family 9 protein [Candidatus Delongbacteria bacterium]|nr:glycosyltransferase family 9 protein [Candidatus Delongbacteria bacterium]MBN2835373.1 glycosyltransferase family 9 protein [Candidatus Delongbacteria bacterium]